MGKGERLIDTIGDLLEENASLILEEGSRAAAQLVERLAVNLKKVAATLEEETADPDEALRGFIVAITSPAGLTFASLLSKLWEEDPGELLTLFKILKEGLEE